jgi:hypothetical protein
MFDYVTYFPPLCSETIQFKKASEGGKITFFKVPTRFFIWGLHFYVKVSLLG